MIKMIVLVLLQLQQCNLIYILRQQCVRGTLLPWHGYHRSFPLLYYHFTLFRGCFVFFRALFIYSLRCLRNL